ncbi:C-C motif chemokine 15-like isoform X1 [Pteronotus mesoamericanus]|uniref:C-C motif chemokine 15-like isoform X1 n=1 Tax=Pteronotus mesoamericanus TaxID=1884717 RepID=UPI0023ED6CBB|nr:C-C motif chemokine 15-like isoform X1 [Pteronotus parnellii mesoamericanus]
MKIPTAALSLLILAAALGPPACGSLARDVGMAIHELDEPIIVYSGVHHPPDCCFSYTPRKIRCRFMKCFFPTTSECHLPAVTFITKREKHVCANPSGQGVQDCVTKLRRCSRMGG